VPIAAKRSEPAASPPKQRDSVRTKAAILQAAQVAFETRGYADVGIRDIAAAAGINSALVLRYFGSKELLFRAALAAAIDIPPLIAGDPKHFGETVVSLFLDTPRLKPNSLPMMILATADPAARAVALDLLHELVIEPIAAWLGGDDGEVRAARISMLCSGFFTYWTLLPVRAFDAGIDPATRRWLAAALQAVVDRTDVPPKP